MKNHKFCTVYHCLQALVLLLLLVGCGESGEPADATAVPPTPTAEPTPIVAPVRARNFIVVATDAPNPPYTLFDEFGMVEGFDSGVLATLAASAGLDYELIVTPYEGVLEHIAGSGNRDFDALIANLPIQSQPPEGIVFTDPYLEIGQVMVVLVDNETIQNYHDLQPWMLVGVAQNSMAAATARDILSVTDIDVIIPYENGVKALQALIDETVTAVITDSYLATYYVDMFPEQLKIVGGHDREAWISHKAYGIALAAGDADLRMSLNSAIASALADGDIEREIVTWLIPNETLEPGESRVGTPTNELVIGFLGDLPDMEPAALSDLIAWEVKHNTMSGLYRFNSNNELAPMLAAAMPVISADGLEYTITLHQNLHFPDGRAFTAADVKWSVDRARSLGNFSINSTLKNSDGDSFADEDAVQVLDSHTVKFVLREPTSYFPALLATPPFFPISRDCYAETADSLSICGGIGPYMIVDWLPGERMRLQANPEWPGQPAPAFAHITLRFYDDVAGMRRSLAEFGSLDIAWRGLPYSDFVALQEVDANGDGLPDFQPWRGPADFKSYLMFNHTAAPWDKPQVRQAVALALDREALAAETFSGSRLPLYSPAPDTVPAHTPALPSRNLAQAQVLLQGAGYNAAAPLEIELWYVSDGRYSPVEEVYAEAIKTQLEETGVFKVNLNSAPFEQFRAQISLCAYPFYLLGWPSPGRPVDYLDIMAWTEFFIASNSFCANYDSPAMSELVDSILAETDPLIRQALYTLLQQKWAEDLPTLDILQQPTFAISLSDVNNIQIDALGLMHYEVLTKGGG